MTADVKVEIWSRSLLREADVVAMERLYREFYVGRLTSVGILRRRTTRFFCAERAYADSPR